MVKSNTKKNNVECKWKNTVDGYEGACGIIFSNRFVKEINEHPILNKPYCPYCGKSILFIEN